MTDLRKAAEEAAKVLANALSIDFNDKRDWYSYKHDVKYATNLLLQALAQPEQSQTSGYAKKIESLIKERDELRQALAQPEQEPVHFLANGVRYKVTHQGYYGCSIVGLPENLNGQWVALVEATDSKHLNCIAHQESTKPEQEPVAYLCENAVGHKYFRWKKPTSHYKPIALYTAPPSKPEPVVEPANSATNFVESKHLAQPEQEPVDLERIYETIIQWDENGGKRSSRELAYLIHALYTAPSISKPLANQEPVFWYRPLKNGFYEGPIHNNSIGGKMYRDEAPNEWKPLYTAPISEPVKERISEPVANLEPVAYWNGKDMFKRADEVQYVANWTDYYHYPLYSEPRSCLTCESLARTVMMDQTSHDTAPTSKPWVSLTDEDWHNLPTSNKQGCERDAEIFDWIEDKLKEKNT